ncbi:MAG: T9SS type A sorting domain-containing protein [bacterium]
MKKITFLLSLLMACAFLSAQTTWKTSVNIDPDIGDEGYEIASGDLDGDGDLDVAIATYFFNGGTPTQDYIIWYSNDGDGNFTEETEVSTSILWVDGLTIADIDGINGDDIVATSLSQGKLVYFPSDGMGGFGAEVVIDNTLTDPGEVIAGDINLDGTIDIATVVYTDNKTVWYSNDGSGSFTAETDIENGSTDGPYYMDMVDYDGDTDLDVVVGFFNTGAIEIYYNQYIESGTMTVSWVKDTQTVDSSGSTFLFNVDFADVNNDGQQDVIKVDFSGGEVVWFDKIKNGASTASTVSPSSIIGNPAKALVVDVDNDNINDVVVTDGGTVDDAIIWYKGNSNAAPASTESLVADNNFIIYDIVAEDFDDDGDNDIISVGNASDTVDYYENEAIDLNISDFNTTQLSIYPNPARDVVNFNGLDTNTTIEVIDILGQRVMQTTVSDQQSLDISALNVGMYFLKLDEQTVFKLIKE